MSREPFWSQEFNIIDIIIEENSTKRHLSIFLTFRYTTLCVNNTMIPIPFYIFESIPIYTFEK